MGRPVLHFEVIGSDGEALRKYYSDMFGWSFQVPPGPMDYGLDSLPLELELDG